MYVLVTQELLLLPKGLSEVGDFSQNKCLMGWSPKSFSFVLLFLSSHKIEEVVPAQ